MVGVKREGTVSDHTGRKIAHDWFRLDVEITKHFVRAPTANEADEVGVNFGTKECHGIGSAKRTYRDVGWEETKGRAHAGDRQSKESCDIGWFDRADLPIFMVLGNGRVPADIVVT